MRIALDCSSAATTDGTGIAVYIRNLARIYASAPPGEEYVVCWRLSRHRRRHALLADLPTRHRRVVWQPLLGPVGGGRLDLFHGLDVRVPVLRRTPVIATVHDVFSVVSDEFAKPKFRKKKIAQYRRTIERARAIVCDSECTARDLRTHLDAPDEKLVVVPLGVSEAFTPEAAANIDRVREFVPVPELYLLFVGRMDRRKNVVRLIKAFEAASSELPPDLHLVLVGAGGHGSEAVDEAVRASSVAGRILQLGQVGEGFLPVLYAAASGLAFATLYEGFGMPVLEAMASGCPVMTSTVGSSSELGGDALLTVDPTDTDGMAAGLVRLMNDTAWRERAIAEGLERAKRYTWERTAVVTRKVYHRVIAGEAPRAERTPALA